MGGRPFNDKPLSVPYHETSTENPFHHEAHLRLRSRAGCHPCATRTESSSSTPAELSVRGIVHERCLGARRSNEVRLPEKQPRKEQPANRPPDKRPDDKPTHQCSVKKSHRSKNLLSKVDRQQHQKHEARGEEDPNHQPEFQDNFKARQKAEDFEEVEHGIGMRYIV